MTVNYLSDKDKLIVAKRLEEMSTPELKLVLKTYAELPTCLALAKVELASRTSEFNPITYALAPPLPDNEGQLYYDSDHDQYVIYANGTWNSIGHKVEPSEYNIAVNNAWEALCKIEVAEKRLEEMSTPELKLVLTDWVMDAARVLRESLSVICPEFKE